MVFKLMQTKGESDTVRPSTKLRLQEAEQFFSYQRHSHPHGGRTNGRKRIRDPDQLRSLGMTHGARLQMSDELTYHIGGVIKAIKGSMVIRGSRNSPETHSRHCQHGRDVSNLVHGKLIEGRVQSQRTRATVKSRVGQDIDNGFLALGKLSPQSNSL
jgi:hypothetical protein